MHIYPIICNQTEIFPNFPDEPLKPLEATHASYSSTYWHLKHLLI